MRTKSRGWKRIVSLLIKLGCVVLGLLFCLWASRNLIAESLMDDVVHAVEAKSHKVGVKLSSVESGQVRVSPGLEVTIPKVVAEFDLKESNKDQLRSNIEIEELSVKPAMLARARVDARNFEIQFHSEDLPPKFPFKSFSNGRYQSSALSVVNAQEAIKLVLERLKILFTENEVEADFNFFGTVQLEGREGEREDALLYTEDAGGGKKRLRFKLEDLQRIAKKANLHVGEDTLRVISEYPLRAPLIILLTRRAQEVSKAAKKEDSSFPEDAYRHVTWSFLLTKNFGEAFAKRITDSHETLDGNSPNERLMDYHNNAVAREFAVSGVKESEIRELVLVSPRVIRSPDEVAGYSELLR
ncbi:DUF6973 domain-containing protein [Rubritalea spongiae]|uniref:DUF6973 domain-containing protein n=1 Tax=Rubritalea spongiae TaxID=430797 RepID=A0ABW5E7G7_9BACT